MDDLFVALNISGLSDNVVILLGSMLGIFFLFLAWRFIGNTMKGDHDHYEP